MTNWNGIFHSAQSIREWRDKLHAASEWQSIVAEPKRLSSSAAFLRVLGIN
jgi:hypothetical protein